MKKSIIFINILAVFFAIYTLAKIASSDYQHISLAPEKVESWQAKIQSSNNIEQLRKFSINSINYEKSLASTLSSGMSIFQMSTIFFLFTALANIVVVIFPGKKPAHPLLPESTDDPPLC